MLAAFFVGLIIGLVIGVNLGALIIGLCGANNNDPLWKR
jgi:hypothetical protein